MPVIKIRAPNRIMRRKNIEVEISNDFSRNLPNIKNRSDGANAERHLGHSLDSSEFFASFEN